MVSATEPRSRDNLPPALVPLSLFDSDPALQAMVDGLPEGVIRDLAAHGALWGSGDMFELGRLANLHPPTLRAHDAHGRRIDAVDFHPAHHALMRRSFAAGMAASLWSAAGDEAPVRSLARAARIYMTSAVDAGHLGLVSSTGAAVAAIGHSTRLAETWVPGLLSDRYDQTLRAPGEKAGLTAGLALTERQAGSDRDSYAVEARQSNDGYWIVRGEKAYVAPTADAHIVLAQTIGGLTGFLVPRVSPNGQRNSVTVTRLRRPLGHRSAATAEARFDDAFAWPLGEAGKGAAIVTDSVALMQLDDALVTVGQLHHALAHTLHHARHRRVSTLPLADHPLMTRVLADMELDIVAATALVFRLAEAYDAADDDPSEAQYVRLMTPVTAYWTSRIGPTIAAECMDCLGGSGYMLDGDLARLFTDLPAAGLRSGGGNVLCMNVIRQLRRNSDLLEVVLIGIQDALGRAGQSSLNILRAAAAVALAEEGSARVLVEQLAMTTAAAVLRRRLPSVVSDTFIETRLTKPWRSSYGMLDSRFDAKAFLAYMFPPRRSD